MDYWKKSPDSFWGAYTETLTTDINVYAFNYGFS